MSSDNKEPTWKAWLDKSIKKSRRIKGGNYVQIATVEKCPDEEGVWKPRCRTVVFRGFTSDEQSIGMKMVTDSR